MSDVFSFSPSFCWGAATAAYQIEGAWDQAGKGPSVWAPFPITKVVTGGMADNATDDVACDHYHRYREDVGLMKAIGLGARVARGHGSAECAGAGFL